MGLLTESFFFVISTSTFCAEIWRTILQQAVHRHIPKLFRTIGSSSPELLQLIADPPAGSENLLLLVSFDILSYSAGTYNITKLCLFAWLQTWVLKLYADWLGMKGLEMVCWLFLLHKSVSVWYFWEMSVNIWFSFNRLNHFCAPTQTIMQAVDILVV